MSKLLRLDNAILKATRSTVNKLARKARTVAGRAVRGVYAIKAKDLNKATKIQRARGKETAAALLIEGTGLPLVVFSARKTRRGVTVRVRKDRGRKVVGGGFLADVSAGESTKQHVFKRKDTLSRRTQGRPASSPPNLPIKALFTTSPASMFEQEGERAVQELAASDMQKLFDQELRYYVSREVGR